MLKPYCDLIKLSGMLERHPGMVLVIDYDDGYGAPQKTPKGFVLSYAEQNDFTSEDMESLCYGNCLCSALGRLARRKKLSWQDCDPYLESMVKTLAFEGNLLGLIKFSKFRNFHAFEMPSCYAIGSVLRPQGSQNRYLQTLSDAIEQVDAWYKQIGKLS